ncbi:MAG: peptidylprolyl isomerase [Flavobacteriales bacterium]
MKIILLNILLFTSILSHAQSIDKIQAIIGSEILLISDIENQYNQILSQGVIETEDMRCQIVDELLLQNFLIHHAKIDSTIEIVSDDIDAEINNRISYFENQLGSLEKVESYFNRTIESMEDELRIIVKDQFYTQKKQSKIISDVKITPNEVKDFYRTLNSEEIPIVPTKLQMSQIVIEPKLSEDKKNSIKEKLNSFRKRIYNGEDFKVLATLYSDDVVSANNGGELGFMQRGDLVPEFERAAFKLKKDEISEVVESKFGYHIIQMIERRGEQINVRHILIKPKFSSLSLQNARENINSIKSDLDSSLISFKDALQKYSDDESKNNGGLIINPKNGTTFFTFEELDPSIRYIVERMNIGDVSDPSLSKSQDGTQAAYRLVKLNNKIEEHKANIVDDFDLLKEYALSNKKQSVLEKWVSDNLANTYINISNDLSECACYKKWIK